MIRLRDEGKTVVFSSHLLEQVEEVSDRVVILHQGQKLCEGSLDDLLELPDAVEIQVDGADHASEDKIRQALEKAGIKGVKIKRPRVSLEEFFIKKVVR